MAQTEPRWMKYASRVVEGELVIGHRVVLESASGTRSEGTFEGVWSPSDTRLMYAHFTDGHIGGARQPHWGLPLRQVLGVDAEEVIRTQRRPDDHWG